MIQPIYTSVSNADIVSCGKRGSIIKSDPIPLLRDNYLGEYRTELEKAKVRKSLGILDSQVLKWGNISGYIEKQEDLVQYVESKWNYKTELNSDIKNIQDAMDYALYFVTNFKGEHDAIVEITEEITNINENISQINLSIEQNSTDIDTLEKSLEETNKAITQLNEDLKSIDVDANILAWVKAKLKDSKTIELVDDNSLEVIISQQENNAIQILENSGLYVLDLSKNITEVNQTVENLRTDINESLKNYVTKEELGGDDFNFVNENDFNQHIQQANAKFEEINSELNKTVKTGEDGHVDTLYVNTISKNNNDDNIKVSNSFEVTDNIPLDVRFIRENLDDLYNLPASVCYSGMGVIVNSQSSLYILRKPEEGITINQEYISNPNNWKCPEDLVTIALTREDYESLEEINPNVFYYIYEDEISKTKEPLRKDFSSEEEFNVAWQEWVNSLKILSQEYMSASWGVEIENKLSEKASNSSVSILLEEIEKIKGTGDGPSLESLNNSIQELQHVDSSIKEVLNEVLFKEEEGESGRLVNVEQKINTVEQNLSNYVTKDYIQDSSNDFIFLKKNDYQQDQEQFKSELSNQINTKNVQSEEISTKNILLNDKSINITEDRLNYDSNVLAYLEEIPTLKVLSQSEYDKLEQYDEEIYYYTYDTEESLITEKKLQDKIKKLEDQIQIVINNTVSKEEYNNLLERINALEQNS